MGNKFTTKAEVKDIGPLVQIKRTMKPDLFKRVITLDVEGGLFFPEIRNNNIKVIEREGIEVGSFVEIEYSFQGTIKDGKRYNNILIESIKNLY